MVLALFCVVMSPNDPTGEILNATSTREVVRLDCGEICRERSAGPVILPSVGIEAGF